MKHKDSGKIAKREAALERRLDRSWGPKDGGSVRYEVSDRVQAGGAEGSV